MHPPAHGPSGYNRAPGSDQAFLCIEGRGKETGSPRAVSATARRARPPGRDFGVVACGRAGPIAVRRLPPFAAPGDGRADQRHGPLHGRPPSPGTWLPEVGGRSGRRAGQRRGLEVGQHRQRCRLPYARETAVISTHDWTHSSVVIARRVAPTWVPTPLLAWSSAELVITDGMGPVKSY